MNPMSRRMATAMADYADRQRARAWAAYERACKGGVISEAVRETHLTWVEATTTLRRLRECMGLDSAAAMEALHRAEETWTLYEAPLTRKARSYVIARLKAFRREWTTADL